MSTTIYEGYRIPLSNHSKIEKANKRIRALVKKAQFTYLEEKIASIASKYFYYYIPFKAEKISEDIIESKKSLKSYFLHNIIFDKEELEYISSKMSPYPETFFNSMLKVINRTIDTGFNTDLNPTVTVYYVVHGKQTVYYLSGNTQVISIFKKMNEQEKLLEDFCYYNNTDKPDNVTTKEWNFRRRVWDNILKESSYLSDAMNCIRIFPNLTEVYSKITRENIIENLPSSEVQFRYVFIQEHSAVLYSEKLNELNLSKDELAKQDISFFTSNYTESMFQSRDMVEDGTYLNHYDEYKEYILEKDELVQMIFSDKVPFLIQ